MESPSAAAPVFLSEGAKAGALARFHAGLAHDLNNRLTTLLGNLLLLESLCPGERAALTDMRTAAEQASDLVRLVQTFTKREPLPPHAVSVNEVLRTLNELVQRLLGASCRVELALSERPVYVTGDEGALEQLIVELAGTCAHGGSLCLRVEDTEEGRAVISGIGAAGLPEAGEAVDALLGYFGARLNETGAGWRLEFPACNFDGGALPEPPPPVEGLRVLLAEGEPCLRCHLKEWLESCGFRVVSVADVWHACEKLNAGETFDAAALDSRLPGGGMERLLAEPALPAARVWMLPFEGCRGRPAEKSLAKPFVPSALHRALAEAAVHS